MNNKDLIKYKNNKINKAIKILKKEYLNQEYIINMDLNSTHFIDEYQFVKYMTNYISRKDGHFYPPIILNYKHYTTWLLNPYGYLCIDFNKIYSNSLNSLVWNKDDMKVVIDLRACQLNVYQNNFLISFLFMFSCIRDKFTENQIIYKYKNNKNEDFWILEYKDNMIIHKMNNKILNKINLKKWRAYKCSELVCIGLQNSIYTSILSKLKIPVYIEDKAEQNFDVYGFWKIGKYGFNIPSLKVDVNRDDSIIGIPEKYYPNL